RSSKRRVARSSHLRIGACSVRFDSAQTGAREASRTCAHHRHRKQDEKRRKKINNKYNGLQRWLDRGCVLFVQHPSKNALNCTLPSGSFIACAMPFGNCDGATEGGIPRSSRFRWFAYVPRVLAGVRKARSD